MGNAPPSAPRVGCLAQRRLASALLRGGKLRRGHAAGPPAGGGPTLEQLDGEVARQARRLMRTSAAGKAAGRRGPPLRLRRAPSEACAGDGLFATEAIGPGRLVAFFPGLFRPEPPGEGPNGEPTARPGGPRSWLVNDMTISLGGGMVDGKAYEQVQQQQQHGQQQQQHDDTRHLRPADVTALKAIRNRFAVGHLFNHPPAEERPHVMAWVIADMQTKMPTTDDDAWYATTSVVASEWFTTDGGSLTYPSPPGTVPPVIGMLTTRCIAAGAEIWFDYNLSASAARRAGAWYTPRDDKQDAAREAAEGDMCAFAPCNNL